MFKTEWQQVTNSPPRLLALLYMYDDVCQFKMTVSSKTNEVKDRVHLERLILECDIVSFY